MLLSFKQQLTIENLKQYLTSIKPNSATKAPISSYEDYLMVYKAYCFKEEWLKIDQALNSSDNLDAFKNKLQALIAPWSRKNKGTSICFTEDPDADVNRLYLILVTVVCQPNTFLDLLNMIMPDLKFCLQIARISAHHDIFEFEEIMYYDVRGDDSKSKPAYGLVKKELTHFACPPFQPEAQDFEILSYYTMFGATIVDFFSIKNSPEIGKIPLEGEFNALEWASWSRCVKKISSQGENASVAGDRSLKMQEFGFHIKAKNRRKFPSGSVQAIKGYPVKLVLSTALELLNYIGPKEFELFKMSTTVSYSPEALEIGKVAANFQSIILDDMKKEMLLNWFLDAWEEIRAPNLFNATNKTQLAKILYNAGSELILLVEDSLLFDEATLLRKEIVSLLKNEPDAKRFIETADFAAFIKRYYQHSCGNDAFIFELINTCVTWCSKVQGDPKRRLLEVIDYLFNALSQRKNKEGTPELFTQENIGKILSSGCAEALITGASKSLFPVKFKEFVTEMMIPTVFQKEYLPLESTKLLFKIPVVKKIIEGLTGKEYETLLEKKKSNSPSLWQNITLLNLNAPYQTEKEIEIQKKSEETRWCLVKDLVQTTDDSNQEDRGKQALFNLICQQIVQRSKDKAEYTCFFGYFRGERSKSEEIAAMNKLLRHLVGMPVTFTPDDKAILLEGPTMGQLIQNFLKTQRSLNAQMLFPMAPQASL